MQDTLPRATRLYFQALFQDMQALDTRRELETTRLVGINAEREERLALHPEESEIVGQYVQMLTALRPQSVDQLMIQAQVDSLSFSQKDCALELQQLKCIIEKQEKQLKGLDMQIETLRVANDLSQDRMALFSQQVQQKANDTKDFQRDNDALLLQEIDRMKEELASNGYQEQLQPRRMAELGQQAEQLKKEKERLLAEFLNEQCIPQDLNGAKQIMAHLRLTLSNLKMSQ